MESAFGPPMVFFLLGFVAVGLLVATVFGVVIVRGLSQWSSNNASPVVTVPAVVVTKRAHTWGGSGDSSASTSYHVTFEVPGGERVELPVPAREFGQLAEADRGSLTHQGTRFKAFDRIRV